MEPRFGRGSQEPLRRSSGFAHRARRAHRHGLNAAQVLFRHAHSKHSGKYLQQRQLGADVPQPACRKDLPLRGWWVQLSKLLLADLTVDDAGDEQSPSIGCSTGHLSRLYHLLSEHVFICRQRGVHVVRVRRNQPGRRDERVAVQRVPGWDILSCIQRQLQYVCRQHVHRLAQQHCVCSVSGGS